MSNTKKIKNNKNNHLVLSEETKQKIIEEYNQWKDSQYAGKDKKARQTKGQFFTPPPLIFKMLEKFESITNKTFLDPTIGAGGLIAAAVIAGATPNMCYGLELDNDILNVCKRRLAKLGVPPCNLLQGDALDSENYKRFVQCGFDSFGVKFETDDNKIEVGLYTPKTKYKVITISNDRNKIKEAVNKIIKKGIKVFSL